MAVRITTKGNGKFLGDDLLVESYSVDEEATPLSVSSSGGATGQIKFTGLEDQSSDGSMILLGSEMTLSDGTNGYTTGRLNAVSGSDGTLEATADSRLNILTAPKRVAPFRGTLYNAYVNYLTVGGVQSGFRIADSTRTVQVSIPGWYGDVYSALKDLSAVQGYELTVEAGDVVVRELRTRELSTGTDRSVSWEASSVDLAQSVEVNYYNNEYRVNGLAYPYGGWNSDVSIYSVSANDQTVITLPIEASLATVQQPVCLSFVGPNDNSRSAYTVIGNDGLPVTPAQWAATGGSVTVEIMDDTKTLKVTIKGSSIDQYSPYRLAMASGESDAYSSLRIVGTGVFTDKKTLTVPTGVTDTETAQEVGATIDSPFISTLAQAYDEANFAAMNYAGGKQTINVSALVTNRADDSGVLLMDTFNDFERDTNPTMTFTTWETTVVNNVTYDQFYDSYMQKASNSFANQAFGNVIGARRKFRDNMYRVTGSTITQDGINYTAERDSLFDEHQQIWAGKTFDDWARVWSGKTFYDHALTALRNP